MCPFSSSPPEAPQDLIATHSNHQVQLSWAPPGDSNGAPITFYILEAVSAGRPPIKLQVSTSFAHYPHVQSLNPVTYVWQGLPEGLAFTFRVAAVNTAGTSAFSPPTTPLMLHPNGSPSPYPASPGYYPPPSGYPSPPSPHHTTTASITVGAPGQQAEHWSAGSIIFFWTIMLGSLACVGTCLWRHNHGEQGLEIVPGHSLLFEFDDMYCRGQMTGSCRRWSPVVSNDSDSYGDSYGDGARVPARGGFVSHGVGGSIPLKETTSFGGMGTSYGGGPVKHTEDDLPKPVSISFNANNDIVRPPQQAPQGAYTAPEGLDFGDPLDGIGEEDPLEGHDL